MMGLGTRESWRGDPVFVTSFLRWVAAVIRHCCCHAEDLGDPNLRTSLPSPAARVPGRVIVTSALVSRWCESARRDAPLGTTRCLVKAYRMACHYGDTEEEVGVEGLG